VLKLLAGSGGSAWPSTMPRSWNLRRLCGQSERRRSAGWAHRWWVGLL